MDTGTRERGRWAEKVALRHLEQRGLRPYRSNFRWRGGEIDLVMLEGKTVVFVEVRFRKRFDFGDGAESVDWRKRNRLTATAQYFLQRHPGLFDKPCRFDVVSVSTRGDQPLVHWIQNAFDG